jgi:hypothetical protein
MIGHYQNAACVQWIGDEVLVLVGVGDEIVELVEADMGAVSPPIQVNLTECLLSDIAENAASFAY